MLLPMALWIATLVWGREGVRLFLMQLSDNPCFQGGVVVAAVVMLAAVRGAFNQSRTGR